jgi:GTP 3',8-cyclase
VPLWVEISATNQCNQKCFYCYVEHLGRSNDFIPRDLLHKIVKDLASAGVKCIEFQGTGEPLMNPGVPDAIISGRQNGMDVCLVTNGTLLNKDIINRILPSLSFIRFSSLAPDEKIYQELHRCPEEHFQKVIKNIESAVKIKEKYKLSIAIVVTFIVFDFTTPYIFETARLLKNIGVDVMALKPSVVLGKNANHNWEREAYHDKYKDQFHKALELQNNNFKVFLNEKILDSFMNGNKVIKNYNRCYGIEFETHIASDAKIYPCQLCWNDEEYCLGDLKKESFSRIWNSRENKDRINKFYRTIQTGQCSEFCCKQHSINGYLWELANPPRFKNVI